MFFSVVYAVFRVLVNLVAIQARSNRAVQFELVVLRQEVALIDISAPWCRQIRPLPSPSPAAKPTALRALRSG